MSGERFDERAREFSHALYAAADWKSNFLGAAYSTRITAAIKHARTACDEAEQLLREDGVPHVST